MSPDRRHSLTLVGLMALTLMMSPGPAVRAAAPPREAGKSPARVVVLGFDGADARMVEKWMDEGYLPNLDRLRREGSWSPLGTTVPPQTPVSWTSFATGLSPGRHGIFDFLSRDVKTYQPGYAMFDIRDQPIGLGRNNRYAGGVLAGLLVLLVVTRLLRGRRGPIRHVAAMTLAALAFLGAARAVAVLVPMQRPVVTRKTEGRAFWEVASDAGIRSRIIRVPAIFPPNPCDHGEIHAGLGVPDIRGNMGNYTFYTTEAINMGSGDTEKGGRVENVAFLDGETDTRIFGPRNKLFGTPPDITVPLRIKLNRSATPPSVTLTLSDTTLTLAEGQWSGWVHVDFPFNPLIKAHGLVRFYLASAQPFGLYLSPVNLDPEKPALPITEPPGWSAELARRFGPYKTLGWENDTFALDEDVLDEQAFLDDVDFTVAAWIPMMDALLTEGDLDLYVHVWDFTDRIGHMFWWTLDPAHPSWTPDLAARYGDVVLKTYQKMDEIVGRVREKLSDDALLIVCSDHGFNTWRKSVNYNTWLVKNGFMTLKSNVAGKQLTLEDLFGQGQFWPNVDWSKTRAYALGLGDLYINLKGREAQGCVDPSEYESVRTALIDQLQAFVDSTNGEHPVRRVLRREEVYPKFDADLIPDLFAANNAGYRVSWQTSLGGIPPQLFEINDKKWSGDHCSLDPEITKGIYLVNRHTAEKDPVILDLFPTILQQLNVPVPPGLDGRTLTLSR